jgi:myosin protein heavy chain
MEDLQNSQTKLLPSHSGMPRTEDVQKLKELLSQLEPETSPLKMK